MSLNDLSSKPTTEELDKILQGLNPRQVEAVTHGEGPLLILAGAGSGKTTVLTRRVAYLIARGVSPGSILAITFTNKAANELKGRIEKLLGKRAQNIWAMTFHSACARILRIEFPNVGRSGNFSIVDTQDQQKIMKQVLKELDLSEKMYTPSGMLSSVSKAKEDLLTPDEYREQANTFFETKVAQVYTAYQRKLAQLDALDFDDLLMQAVVLFRDNPNILSKYQERFRHILVDEYQDTNRAQYELTRLIAQKYKNICVVGDDDQSIYNFRGADIRNILEFERDYPGCRVVKLEQNYRSTQVILDGAYHVVSNNRRRKEKRLWTAKEGGPLITVYAAQSGEDEAVFVSREIENLVVSGVPLGSIAILYRTHSQSRLLEEAFMNRGLPYKVLSGYRFYERKHIKDAICYLKLLVYPRDYISLERIANEPPRGLGPAAIRKILDHSQSKNMSLIEALSAAEEVKGLNRPQKAGAKELGETLMDIAAHADEWPPHETLQEVLVRTGYKKALTNEGTPESLARLEDLDELLGSIKAFYEADNGGLREYLETCALVSDQDAYDETVEACVMGTLHSAKGLEFEVVFMVGMEEGMLPHQRSIGDEMQIEEERRLTYVGMTRAKRLLYLTFSFSRTSYVGPSQTRVSRFIAEIPRELLEVRTWES